MNKDYNDLAGAIEKGVSAALKNTPVTVITKPEVVLSTDYNIIYHMKAVKAYCYRFRSCSECNVQEVCNLGAPCDWRI